MGFQIKEKSVEICFSKTDKPFAGERVE